MNIKQSDSVARYAYDISKALLAASIVMAATAQTEVESLLQRVVAAAIAFRGAWEMER